MDARGGARRSEQASARAKRVSTSGPAVSSAPAPAAAPGARGTAASVAAEALAKVDEMRLRFNPFAEEHDQMKAAILELQGQVHRLEGLLGEQNDKHRELYEKHQEMRESHDRHVETAAHAEHLDELRNELNAAFTDRITDEIDRASKQQWADANIEILSGQKHSPQEMSDAIQQALAAQRDAFDNVMRTKFDEVNQGLQTELPDLKKAMEEHRNLMQSHVTQHKDELQRHVSMIIKTHKLEQDAEVRATLENVKNKLSVADGHLKKVGTWTGSEDNGGNANIQVRSSDDFKALRDELYHEKRQREETCDLLMSWMGELERRIRVDLGHSMSDIQSHAGPPSGMASAVSLPVQMPPTTVTMRAVTSPITLPQPGQTVRAFSPVTPCRGTPMVSVLRGASITVPATQSPGSISRAASPPPSSRVACSPTSNLRQATPPVVLRTLSPQPQTLEPIAALSPGGSLSAAAGRRVSQGSLRVPVVVTASPVVAQRMPSPEPGRYPSLAQAASNHVVH